MGPTITRPNHIIFALAFAILVVVEIISDFGGDNFFAAH